MSRFIIFFMSFLLISGCGKDEEEPRFFSQLLFEKEDNEELCIEQDSLSAKVIYGEDNRLDILKLATTNILKWPNPLWLLFTQVNFQLLAII